jgi:excisionase family DNA binding protein
MLTTAAAAARLGITPGRIRQLIAAGQLAATRHGRDWLIQEEALAAVAQRPGPGYPKGRPRKPQRV